jgi:AcrR family transcriptional regulator
MGSNGGTADLIEVADYAERWRNACGHEASRMVLRDAAHDMIRTKGLEDFNMRALAKHIGLSPMAAYRYYGSKDLLIEDIRSSIKLSFAACLKDAAALAVNPVDQFEAMCCAYVDFALRNEQDYRLMFGSVASLAAANDVSPDDALSWSALLQVLREIDQGLSNEALQDQAHVVWSALHGLVMLHISRRLVLGRSLDQVLSRLKNVLAGSIYV